jgi:hypothetical protein
MRIEISRESERLGAVRIYGLKKVDELDAGPGAADGTLLAVGRRGKINRFERECGAKTK